MQLCGDCEVARKWISGQYSLGQECRGKIGQIQTQLCTPVSKIDDFVKHIFREHTREVDHWANLEGEGQRTTIVDRSDNTKTWKAVKGF